MSDSSPDAAEARHEIVSLSPSEAIWDRFFTVSPLALVGTREESGEYDLAPKHQVMPIGFEGYFGFVCTPRHRTYHNARREGAFTVSFPRPTQIVLASLAAAPRCGDEGDKPALRAVPTFPARVVDGELLEDGYLFLECELDRVDDDYGDASLLVGRIVAVHVRDSALRASEVSDQELIHDEPLFAYLHPGRFTRIRRSVVFPLPADFRH